ncbi:hypothetical protein NL526_29445, partial [Klebsiella pneumoniae]|nr:hypothetical protein [Klebsiella pneumoniae]
MYWSMIVALLYRGRQWRTMMGYRLGLGLAALTIGVALFRLAMSWLEKGSNFSGVDQLLVM